MERSFFSTLWDFSFKWPKKLQNKYVNKVDKRQRRRQRLKTNWSLIITIFDGLTKKLYQFKTENLCLKKEKLIILTKK